MDKKKCFKCGLTKDLKMFYTHASMADGHLNKCIECTKKDSNERFLQKINDPIWAEKEKARNRIRCKGQKQSATMAHRKKWIDKFPEKRLAHKSSQSIKTTGGLHKHHWSYNEEHFKDVIMLSVDDHKKAHRFLIYDQERKMYRRNDTMELLDSRESHLNFIDLVI